MVVVWNDMPYIDYYVKFNDIYLQDIEAVIKGKFDAVLDTIGIPETERIGINLLNRGGHYMTLQVIGRKLVITFSLGRELPSLFFKSLFWFNAWGI